MKDQRTGQAAVELAIFGAILIFVLGSVIRAAVGNSYSQNQNLKAMRMAMLSSFQTAQGSPAEHRPPATSRNNASVTFIEDRLAPDLNKYGALERNPYIVSGGGTFSNLLNYPVDKGEVIKNLPIMDIYINGQHFPLTTAGFIENIPTKDIPDNICNYSDPCHQRQCARLQREKTADGHRIFYAIIANGTDEFDPDLNTKGEVLTQDQMFDLNRDGNTSDVPAVSIGTNIGRDQIAWRWHGAAGVPKAGNVNGVLVNAEAQAYPSYDVDGDMQEEIVYKITNSTVTVQDNQAGDVDPTYNENTCGPKPGLLNDFAIYTFTKQGTYLIIKEGLLYNPENNSGPITQSQFTEAGLPSSTFNTLKNNGWIDSSGRLLKNIDTSENQTLLKQQFPGAFDDKTSLFDKVNGVLHQPHFEFQQRTVRSTNKRNQVDLIQRLFQLSNNTGHFCSGTNFMTRTECTWGANKGTNGKCPAGTEENPVEVCSTNCTSDENFKKTCYNPNAKLLYIRSRLEDQRGRSWITNVTGDLKLK